MNPTNTFQQGDTASGVAQALGVSAADFLAANPNLAAQGAANDYQGLTGMVQVGQTYNVPGAQVPAPPILSSSAPQQELNSATNQLNQVVAEPDPYMAIFDQMMQNNSQTEKNTIASATAAGANQQRALGASQQQYLGELASTGARTGENRYLQNQFSGKMESARQSYIQKFKDIDTQEKLAIADANLAKQNGDVQLMVQKLDYLKELKKRKARYYR